MTVGTSVIIPVRNGSNFIADAINSVLAQLNDSDEVVVVWDDSEDNTVPVLESLKDGRISIMKGPGLGVSGGRNAGLSSASGAFVAFLDHDDLWPPDRHRKMMQMMVDNPQVDAVFGRMRIRLDPGAIPWQWIVDMDNRHIPGPNLGTGLFRRTVLTKIAGFDESLRFGEDVDYFFRLQETGMRIAHCDVDGLIYRRHATNCTNDQLAVQNSVFDVIQRKMARARNAKT
jgi:glycosyltransferase involved in cell wall biosynthesis